MSSLIQAFVSDEMLDDDYHSFSPSGTYHTIPAEGTNEDGTLRGTAEDTLKYVNTLPNDAAPELFGFHDNAAITCASNEQRDLCAIVLSLQPRTSSGGGKSRETVIDELAVDILNRVPGPYDLEPIIKKYPVCYEQSMNTVLQQEVERYNKLLKEMKSSNKSIRKALVGQLVMTEELDAMATAMFNQNVPANWEKKAYPSLKPLAAWVNELLDRLDFLNQWIEHGCPSAYWISGFFFPQAFLTGTLQNYARKFQYPIDRIDFTTKVLDFKDETEISSGPDDGCYIYGLFLEGARWDAESRLLAESKPKELYTSMSPLHLEPMLDRTWKVSPLVRSREGFYICPVYKTLVRAGTLSTTGHSTNFVIPLEIPSDRPEHHWIKRGVAFFTGLMY
jgi:dynein heavy chain